MLYGDVHIDLLSEQECGQLMGGFVVPKLEKIIAEHIHSIDGLKTIHPTLFASLVTGKFVTDDLYEEKIVKNHIQEKLSSEKILRLTINPTLDCNLRCWYCSLLPICTICSQTHIESSSALCPVEISDEDKEQQIFMHFKANFGKYIS